MMVFVALCLLSVQAGMDSSMDEPWYNDPAARRVSNSPWNFALGDWLLREFLVRLRKIRCLLRDFRSG